MTSEPDLELSILMPCLNEAQTLAACVANARQFLTRTGTIGEVLVADNGSTDGSQDLARQSGARVVDAPVRGYGGALAGGVAAAEGRYVVMGDADLSYDFSRLDPFLERLRQGADIVVGNRFRGGIAPGAMPFLHRYLGNPVLSFAGRLFFRVPAHDFHCGLRGFKRNAVIDLDLRTTGMEYASEMLVVAALNGLRIDEVPTTLSKDGRSRPPHLRTWRDGWRHLRFLLIYSPRWLFLYPGVVLILAGLALSLLLLPGPLHLAPAVDLDVHTLIAAGAAVLAGLQLILFGLIAQRFAAANGLIPDSARFKRLLGWVTLERLLVAGLVVLGLGIIGVAMALLDWSNRGFGPLDYRQTMRLFIPSTTAIVSGLQMAFGAFLLGMARMIRAPNGRSTP